MAAYEYDDFWLEFTPREGGGYDVAARAPDGETSRGEFELPFTEDQLENAVRTLGYTRAATTRDIGEVTTERRLTAEQLGGELASSLLAGPTGELYGNARATAVSKGRGVRLWLSLGKAPGLLSVPWEFLYLQPTFLASQRKTPIVRFLSTDAPVAPRRIEDTVRILGVVASPDGLPKLDVAQERKRVDDALGKARQGREVAIDWLDPATPRALRLALQKGDYHILHFVGHSGYTDDDEATNGGSAGGVIFLENEDHTAAQVSDAQLVNLLGDQDSLRLVVLNSCEGARTSVRDPFAGIATSIVALGIPAVVAMQFEISDKAAITFAEELYQSLIARQEPIDVAVAEARKAVFTEVNETEWATPVLFLRNEDGRLFDFAPVVVAAGAIGAATVVAHGDTPATGADIAATGTTPVAHPLVTVPAQARPAWLIGVVAVAVIALLFGGGYALGIIGGPTESASPSDSGAIETESPSPSSSDESSPEPTPTSSTPDESTTPTDTIVWVPGTTDQWVGPREKSNKLAVAGGPERTITNISTVTVPDPGATAAPANEASNLPDVYDFDPTWDPKRGVIAFARFQNGRSDIRYVVPGFGRLPTGGADRGIEVHDPISKATAKGTRDHLPAWRDDGNLLFARTEGCSPGPGCRENIVLSTFTKRIGDYIVPATVDPETVSDGWSEIQKISVDPLDDHRILVTGRNFRSPGAEFGVWVVDTGGSRDLLAGSERATYAIFGANDNVVAVELGTRPGWGSSLLVWERSVTGEPRRIDSDFIFAGFQGTGGVPITRTELGWISSAPGGDDRYAVFASNLEAERAGTLPAIVILGADFHARQAFEPVAPEPPNKPIWNDLIALGW